MFDLGTLPDGRPFLAMKLIKGQTLDELLKLRPNPSEDGGRFVAVFEQVCQAMAYAHAHGVIHRDLKPGNVLVGSFGEVQVMDRGLAKVLASRGGGRPESDDPDETSASTAIQSPRDSADQFTQAGSVLGTPAYMPPEQALGAVHEVTARSDVFGLGGILAAVLTGRPPFVGDTAETPRVMAARGEVAECFVRLDASGADPELVALAKWCLATKPGDRPADAGVLARAVAELWAAADERARRAELERVRIEGEQATAVMREIEQRKRRKVQSALAAAVLVVLLGGGVFAAAPLGDSSVIAVERRRKLLESALSRRPEDLGLLMALGGTYPGDQKEGVTERLRWYQAAVAAAPANAAAHNNLGFALYGADRLDEAIACYKKAIELDPKNAGARSNLAQAERMAAVRDKLTAFGNGSYTPTGTTECLGLADWLAIKKLHHAATRVYAAAFAAEPQLAAGLWAGLRYLAACHAVLSAAGQGEDAANLDAKERTRLRQQSLDWLRADLALRAKQLETGKPADRAEVQKVMCRWQQDTNLAGIRDKEALENSRRRKRRRVPSCGPTWQRC